MVSFGKALLNPYFWRGVRWGGRLTSREFMVTILKRGKQHADEVKMLTLFCKNHFLFKLQSPTSCFDQLEYIQHFVKLANLPIYVRPPFMLWTLAVLLNIEVPASGAFPAALLRCAPTATWD